MSLSTSSSSSYSSCMDSSFGVFVFHALFWKKNNWFLPFTHVFARAITLWKNRRRYHKGAYLTFLAFLVRYIFWKYTIISMFSSNFRSPSLKTTVKPFFFVGIFFHDCAKIYICGVVIFALLHCGRLFSLSLVSQNTL